MLINKSDVEKISWTEAAQGLRRLKQIGIKYNYMRGTVQFGNIQVKPYC